jgi:signal transduction histidine kinase
MSLRTRILLFLFLFALVPLLMAVVINLPLVLDRVDDYSRQTYLHDLRQDFRDLDQHLASRDANVRLLARLPEPSLFAPDRKALQARVDLERVRYTEWVNRILGDESDIFEIRFLDRDANEHFWLLRSAVTRAWYAPPAPLSELPKKQLQVIRSGKLKDVAYTPVRVGSADGVGAAPLLTLQMMAPIRVEDTYWGAVVISLDISSLVTSDTRTRWVMHDGSYLYLPDSEKVSGNAFERYPGLDELFAKRKPSLWERGDQRVIWVPMFVTESGLPLWVGRQADTSQLVELRTELVHRVLAIVFGLILLLLIAARMLAKRVEEISTELIEGIHETLESNRAVEFNWSDTHELEQLSADLTSLSARHAVQARSLLEHTRELEDSNRYKSEFLANVSHELRTPLNSILLLSKMLKAPESGLADEQREQAGVIHKAGNDLRTLIDNILDLSKIEAGRFEVHPEQVSLRPLLEDLRELMQAQFDQKALQLKLDWHDSAVTVVRSDSGMIRQILKNFLANALKFTAAGEVRLVVRPAKAPFALEISVSDTGIGIPREKQAHIFDAFRQADGSTNRRFGGTGLGLTISRQLADLLQGEIRLRSEPGQGTTFSLLLPADFDPQRQSSDGDAASRGRAAEEPAAGSEGSPLLDLSGNRVMLVLSDIRAQLSLSQMFQRWGTLPLLACDMEEACETIDGEGRPDVLVFDPRDLGEQACDSIRALTEASAGSMLAIAMGAPDALGCEPPQGIHWLTGALGEEPLYRILAEWVSQRENG